MGQTQTVGREILSKMSLFNVALGYKEELRSLASVVPGEKAQDHINPRETGRFPECTFKEGICETTSAGNRI